MQDAHVLAFLIFFSANSARLLEVMRKIITIGLVLGKKSFRLSASSLYFSRLYLPQGPPRNSHQDFCSHSYK